YPEIEFRQVVCDYAWLRGSCKVSGVCRRFCSRRRPGRRAGGAPPGEAVSVFCRRRRSIARGGVHAYVELIHDGSPVRVYQQLLLEEAPLGFGPEWRFRDLHSVRQRSVAGDEGVDAGGVALQSELLEQCSEILVGEFHDRPPTVVADVNASG